MHVRERRVVGWSSTKNFLERFPAAKRKSSKCHWTIPARGGTVTAAVTAVRRVVMQILQRTGTVLTMVEMVEVAVGAVGAAFQQVTARAVGALKTVEMEEKVLEKNVKRMLRIREDTALLLL